MASLTYKNPPLVEVAISVQFEPPKTLTLAHLGAFWATQKKSLPNVRAIQAIPTTTEPFGGQGAWLPPSLQLALSNEPDCRLQMTSANDEWMCQLQRNRIVINWRKRSELYPRFSATRERFFESWKAWTSFLVESEIALPKLHLWEVTYVNRIPKPGLWETPSDWPKIFPGLWGGNFASHDATGLCGFHGQWVWESKGQPARLYVDSKPGRILDDPPQDVLIVSLTARGPVDLNDKRSTANDDQSTDSIVTGVNFGHELIVGTFEKIASSDAKQNWEA